jgi:hypothetical protein
VKSILNDYPAIMGITFRGGVLRVVNLVVDILQGLLDFDPVPGCRVRSSGPRAPSRRTGCVPCWDRLGVIGLAITPLV